MNPGALKHALLFSLVPLWLVTSCLLMLLIGIFCQTAVQHFKRQRMNGIWGKSLVCFVGVRCYRLVLGSAWRFSSLKSKSWRKFWECSHLFTIWVSILLDSPCNAKLFANNTIWIPKSSMRLAVLMKSMMNKTYRFSMLIRQNHHQCTNVEESPLVTNF